MTLGINRTSSICLLQQDDDHPIRMVDNHLQHCQVHYVLESSKASLKPFEIALSALDEKKTTPFDGGVITNENGIDTLTKATKEIWDGVACLANLQLKPKISTVPRYANFDDDFKTDVFANVMSTCCDDVRTTRFRLVFPFFPRKFYLMFEQPEIPSDVFANQFTPILWKAFGLFLILITVVMVVANRLKDKNNGAREATFLTFNMLTQTGADQEPQDGTRRLIFIVGFFFCLVSFNYFSANIISSLQQIKSFESLEEVVNNLKMTLSVPTFPMFLNVLRSSPNSEAVKIVSRFDKNENVVGFENQDFILDKLASIQQGNKWDSIIAPDNFLFGALINDHSPFNRNQLCKFHYFTIPGTDTQMGIFAKKDLPLHAPKVSDILKPSQSMEKTIISPMRVANRSL
ncbi:hypothetical protein TCAL_12692 [Tigriopus californicus]|uniref:Ionotropic glutamate receptor C-terminal domain-containing protein n=1 Tax=Tigriopus californicus TaxID=6832 RepID=A0A553PM56_TIGCA|nr:hypothetical protein TCAL_12692 [Tigriopus californicus]